MTLALQDQPTVPKLDKTRRAWLKGLTAGSIVVAVETNDYNGPVWELGFVITRSNGEIVVETADGSLSYTQAQGTWTMEDPDEHQPQKPDAWLVPADDPFIQTQLRVQAASKALAEMLQTSSRKLAYNLNQGLTSERVDDRERAQRLLDRAIIFKGDMHRLKNTTYMD